MESDREQDRPVRADGQSGDLHQWRTGMSSSTALLLQPVYTDSYIPQAALLQSLPTCRWSLHWYIQTSLSLLLFYWGLNDNCYFTHKEAKRIFYDLFLRSVFFRFIKLSNPMFVIKVLVFQLNVSESTWYSVWEVFGPKVGHLHLDTIIITWNRRTQPHTSYIKCVIPSILGRMGYWDWQY